MTSQYTSLRRGIRKRDWSWRSLCLDTWLPEIAATLFSIACFIAICAILYAYDQESRPELSYGLSLNAIISALATGCKSSLIFVIGEAMGQLKWVWFYANPKKLLDIQTLDSAGRGPLGSIASLFHKTRRSLASIGAAVLILLLAFDPFIQQIISYPTRLAAVHDTGLATTKRLDYFAPAIDYDFAYSVGLWSEDTMLTPTCPSGNCTWQKFQSSGMCSQCSDITKSMNLKCEFTGNESYSLPELGDDWQYQYVNLTCDLSPPQGNSIQFDLQFDLTLSPHFDWAYDTPGLSWHVISAYDSSNMYTLDKTMNQTFTWPGDSDPLMVMAYAEIEFNDDYIHSDILSGIRVDKATECSLELCIFEYEVSVENGTPNMTTSVLDYGQLFWRNSSGPSKHTLCWKPTSSPPDIKIDDHTTNSEFLQLSPVEFAFCGVAYEIELDEKVFVGSCSQGHVRGPNITTNPDVTAYDNPFNGDPNALRIGSFGLDTIMSNLAKHMNKEALRLNGSDVHGTTFVTEVFVEVQWLWLILPIILVVSGTMFIAIVIIQNKTNGTTLWKSSVLAFLYHGLHEVNKDDSMTASVMEKKAEGLVVQLQESEDHGGLILQEKKDSM